MLCYVSIDKIEPPQCFIIGLRTHVGHFPKFQEFRNIYSKKREETLVLFISVYLLNISSLQRPVLSIWETKGVA